MGEDMLIVNYVTTVGCIYDVIPLYCRSGINHGTTTKTADTGAEN